MKRPEYVAVVTRIYAALLREKRRPTAEELRALELAFSRDGFTDGYWRGRLGPDMFGTRSERAPDPDELFRAAKAAYDREDLRTVPVSLSAEILAGQPARLTVKDRDGNGSFVQDGAVPEPARTRPLEAEDVKARLAKTGGTVFRAEEVEVVLDPGLSLPASSINALRREGLKALATLRALPPRRREREAAPLPEAPPAPEEPRLTVSLFRGAQLTETLADLAPAIVYVPAERIEEFDLSPCLERGIECCASLPRICKDSELPSLRRLLAFAKGKGCTALSVQNIGQLALAQELGLPLRGDFGLNVFNSRSVAQLADWGLASALLSFELRYEQMRDVRKYLPCEAIVYGRLPLMLTEHCLTANGLGCREKNLRGPCRAPHALTDRRGEAFPVLSVFGCRSEIENSRTMFLADKPDYRRCGLTYARLRFTTETAEECAHVLRRYLGQCTDAPADFTRGLFYRGVE